MQRLDPREKLETLIPNTPKFTSGKVVAHSNGIGLRSTAESPSTRGLGLPAGPSLVLEP